MLARDPRRRLRRGRPRRLRPPRRLPRAPGPALGRAVGAVEDRASCPAIDELAPPAPRRAARVAARRRSCTATTASTTRCWRPTTRPRSSRCSTGRCRRSATRSPTSACSSSTGASAEAQIIATGAAIDAERRLPHRGRGRRALRQASAAATSTQLDFYVVFASYKLAIIVEGIHARYLMGKTLGEGFEHMGALVDGLVGEALQQADASPIQELHGAFRRSKGGYRRAQTGGPSALRLRRRPRRSELRVAAAPLLRPQHLPAPAVIRAG